MLYISDLDGTLLQSDASLSTYARSCLEQLLKKGLVFTVATARSVQSMKSILQDLPVSIPVVASNGAYVSDLKTGRHLHIQGFPPTLSWDLLLFLKERGFKPFVAAYGGEEDHLYYELLTNGGMMAYCEELKRLGDPRLQHTAQLESVMDETVTCMFVIDRIERLRPLGDLIARTYPGLLDIHYYDNVHSDWAWLTLYDHRATKAGAIERVIRELGYSPGELTVFGDGLNDLSMFRFAGRSVAVENARDELKAIATRIIGPHSQDSVVNFILEEQGV